MCLREKVKVDFKSCDLSSWKIGIATFQGQKIRGRAGFWVGMEIIMGLAWERPFEMPEGDVQLTVNYRGLGLTRPSDGAVGQGR